MNDRNWGGKREGSGRKPTGKNTKTITLTLTKDEAAELKWRAEYDAGVTISNFILKQLRLNTRLRPLYYDDEFENKKKKVLLKLQSFLKEEKMTIEQMKKQYPKLFFIKTSDNIPVPDYHLMKSKFIPDFDTKECPPLQIGMELYPISKRIYPAICAVLTSMQAGAYAVTVCNRENWELTKENLECAWGNLESDLEEQIMSR